MRKKYNTTANSRNTPHLYARVFIGAMLFVFTGLNLAWLYVMYAPLDLSGTVSMALLILVCLGKANVIIVDNRFDMVRWPVIACYGVIYIVVSIGIAYYLLKSWRFAIICCYEIASIFAIIFGFKRLMKYDRS